MQNSEHTSAYSWVSTYLLGAASVYKCAGNKYMGVCGCSFMTTWKLSEWPHSETSSCLHKRRKGLEDRIEEYLIFCRPCNCLVYYIYISLYIYIFECVCVCVCVCVGMYIYTQLGFPDGSAGKESTCNAGDPWV